jgi:hypothetical protein
MEEHRELERFDLRLLAEVETQNGERHRYDLFTRNISAYGAFFDTTDPLPLGARVRIKLLLDLKGMSGRRPTRAEIRLKGSVLRSNSTGMAVRFENQYEILPLYK